MALLGIESTAHTFGVGVVGEDAAGRPRVLSNQRAMAAPAPPQAGEAALGIHPREAAHAHAEAAPALVAAALAQAGMPPGELEGVAFSQGPGLGPCLRVGATVARALAIRHGKPLVGVNHCVAHLEIGRGLSGFDDPLLLYASGGNTQILAFARGRYRVFGETLDVGVGNALDKFAREQGIPFPGGPELERLAASTADPSKLLELPYVVKGMDLSFSGLATAASRAVADGHPLADVAHALQEHAFAALVETAERALAATGKRELVLGGGVACNSRLQAMARAMAEARGAAFFAPPRDLLLDNGAMIAWTGLLKLRSGGAVAVEESQVRPHERSDAADAPWRAEPPPSRAARLDGAEARIEGRGPGRLAKVRLPKPGRHPLLDARLRAGRTRDEGRLLLAARRAGVAVPVLYDADRGAATLVLEDLPGPTLEDQLRLDGPAAARARLAALGRLVGRLHGAGLAHGDLTLRNVLVRNPALLPAIPELPVSLGAAHAQTGISGRTGNGANERKNPLPGNLLKPSLVLLDFGLGGFTQEAEARGTDLHVLEEALAATRPDGAGLFAAFLDGYRTAPCAPAALARLEAIRERGRYR